MIYWRKLFGGHYDSEEVAGVIVADIFKHTDYYLRKKEFRELLGWDRLSDEDKGLATVDLEMGGLVFAYLLLEALEDHVEHPTSKASARKVRNELIPAFASHIEETGPNANLREPLIQLAAQRCEECRDDFRRRKSELKAEDLERIYWIEFCASNTLNHLLADVPPDEEKDNTLYENLAMLYGHLAGVIQKRILKMANIIKIT